MAKDSRLAEIYRQELKSKGLFSAFISASAERNKEKLDIRNMIPKSGISGAALEKIFGKGYRYKGDSVRETRGPSGRSEVTSKAVEEKLTRIGVDTKLTAKNTIVLPAMARDMNLMRMNMQKMVKLSGGTPSTKADMFFKRAGDRETQYESQYKRNGGSLSPSSVSGGKEGAGSFFGGLFSLLGGALSGAGSLISALIPSLTGFFGLLVKAIAGAGIIGLIFNNLDPETQTSLMDFAKKMFIGMLRLLSHHHVLASSKNSNLRC